MEGAWDLIRAEGRCGAGRLLLQPGTDLHDALGRNVLWTLGAHPCVTLTQWNTLYVKQHEIMAPFLSLLARSFNTEPELVGLHTMKEKLKAVLTECRAVHAQELANAPKYGAALKQADSAAATLLRQLQPKVAVDTVSIMVALFALLLGFGGLGYFHHKGGMSEVWQLVFTKVLDMLNAVHCLVSKAPC
jgi:hypothetical protein